MARESRYILDVSRAHSGDLGNLHCIKHRPPFVAEEQEKTGTEGEVMEWGWVRVGGGCARAPALSKAKLDKWWVPL
jgi:hypothetical protein